jgi:hypothetical protein
MLLEVLIAIHIFSLGILDPLPSLKGARPRHRERRARACGALPPSARGLPRWRKDDRAPLTSIRLRLASSGQVSAWRELRDTPRCPEPARAAATTAERR